MRNPTLRKIRNRGLTPIRYRTPDDSFSARSVRHGWIVKRKTRGALVVHFIGDERNRHLSALEARHVEEIQ